MAAVLCNACSDICNGACEVCGSVCRTPFQLCGRACSGCCDVFADVCANMAQLCASPFSIFVGVALMFNVPSVYLGLPEIADLECRGSQWLLVQALFSTIHIVAAVYMAVVVSKADHARIDLENPSRHSTAFGRAGHLLCYDPVVALYILVLLGFLGWLWTGAIWSLNGKASNGCSETVQGKIVFALSFGWAFIFCGMGALGIGVCCAYCGVGENTTNVSYVPNYGAAAPTTPYVNVVGTSSKKSSAGGTTKQEVIPTVQATLF